jgi:Predicted SPOUT methyltransferase
MGEITCGADAGKSLRNADTICYRSSVIWLWALSRLTLQHELALLLALEQVYRAYSILVGAPYHRSGAGS